MQTPPQSTSDSRPLRAPSWQVSLAQVSVGVPETHRPEAQSPRNRHDLPPAQGAQSPPQSTSASVASHEPFEQWAGSTQTPFVHSRDPQSLALTQALPGSHGLQSPPPQSTAVSAPLSTPSVQE
jgi:hypothetical protein